MSHIRWTFWYVLKYIVIFVVLCYIIRFEVLEPETFKAIFSRCVLTYQRGLACFDKLIFASLTFGVLRRCGGAFFAVVFHCFDADDLQTPVALSIKHNFT